jgi:hypothetical protein
LCALKCLYVHRWDAETQTYLPKPLGKATMQAFMDPDDALLVRGRQLCVRFLQTLYKLHNLGYQVVLLLAILAIANLAGCTRLHNVSFLYSTFKATVSPSPYHQVKKDLARARQGYVMSTDLHLTYLVTPPRIDMAMNQAQWER